MAVTNKLGTADSLLGNLLLGGSGPILTQSGTDNPTTSESVTRTLSVLRTTTDTPTLSESATRSINRPQSATDSPTTSENVGRIFVGLRTTVDSPITSEIVSRILDGTRTTEDAPALSDIAEITVNAGDVAFDVVTLSDAVVVVTIQSREATDAPIISEDAVVIVAYPRTTTDSTTLSESIERTGDFNRVVTATPTISESTDWVAILDRTVENTPTISEVATGSKTFIKDATDSSTVSESVLSHIDAGRTIVESPTVSETITTQKILFKSISQSLSITHSNLVATPIQSVEQGLVISQSVGVVTDISKSVSSTLSFSQSADYEQFKPTETSNTLVITQSVDVVQTTGVGNELVITQDVTYQYDPHFEQGSQIVIPTQSVGIVAIFNRTIEQPLTIAQTVTKLKIKPLEASNTLTILQQVLGGPLRRASNTLDDLDHDVVVDIFRNKSLSQSIAITQSVGLQMILNRSMISTLVFKDEHPVSDGAGGIIEVPNLIYTKGGVNLGIDNCCPVPSATTVFQSGTRTIVLPNPEFNDTEGLVAAVTIKRTITGDTYSYVKKSANRKLKYKFVISQRKAYELRRFLLDHLGDRITMTNWKGEMWTGFLLTDPAEITSSARGGVCTGDLYEINLEYQGVRVN